MNKARYYLSQKAVRASVAIAASALLVAGATWHGFAADTLTTTPQTAGAAQSPPPAPPPVLGGGRRSHADVVKMVAPGGVTVRVEGRAPTRPPPIGHEWGTPGTFLR